MENTFIKISGVDGESDEDEHKGWIVVKSVDWGLERTVDQGDMGSSQRGYANVNFNRINVTSEVTKASMGLMTKAASGVQMEEVLIDLCRASDDPAKGMETFLTFKLEKAFIDSYSVTGGEEQVPEESWAVAYRNVEVLYKANDRKTNKVDKQSVFTWDLEKGKAK